MNAETLTQIESFINKVGLPVALIVINVVAVFLFAKWVAPRLERWVQSWVDAESKNAATLRDLATKTMQLSEANSKVLTEMSLSLTRLVDQCVYCREARDVARKGRPRRQKQE